MSNKIELPDSIADLYTIKALSCPRIADMFCVRQNVVRDRLISMGVEIRDAKTAARLRMINGRNNVFGQKGSKNPAWRGGRHMRGEYWNVWAPDHPRNNGGYIYEHILVWEKAHGRYLPDGWIVHHINGIKTDNVPVNLLGMPRGRHSEIIPTLMQRINQLEYELEKLLPKAPDWF